MIETSAREPTPRRLGRVVGSALVITSMMLLAGLASIPAGAVPAANANTILILDVTVSGGAGSLEAGQAGALGYDVEVVDSATWAAMSTAEFASYRAIVLGDPTCGWPAPAAPAANAATWAAAVTGGVVIVGTDPTYHQSQGGAAIALASIRFAASDPSRTGAYLTTSCYYHGVPPATPVPMLDGFGTFTATAGGSCSDNIAVVATHPDLAEYTESNLGPWGCSVHNAFDAWPLDFEALALALDGPAIYTAPGGEVGAPYVLARGVRVISDITLAPEAADLFVGDTHTVTATVTSDDLPVVGTEVDFAVIAGPHTGTSGNATTDSDGNATFSYTGTLAGNDTIEATFTLDGVTQRSNRVLANWTISPIVEHCVDLLAGQTRSVGEVCVTDDGTTLTVRYAVTDPTCTLLETHLAVSADDLDAWGSKGWLSKAGNPSPGRFPYSATYDPAVSNDTYLIPFADIGAGTADLLYIAAHAVVLCGDDTETAWGAGERITAKGAWATYLTYETQGT